MGATVNINVPRTLWSARDTMRLAQNTLASIKLRTSKGIDANGEGFKEYSTEPIYVAKKGARLSPKGGRPSRTGNSVYYAQGYEQYKAESKRTSKKKLIVDLVLSGQLMNNLIVIDATATAFKIGLTKHVKSYGYHVNDKREFLGLSDDDIEILTNAVNIEIRKKLGLSK
tara:strand:+ start:13274 stop:13783 length:510 start_codon:yes stop_codon:yes gene_type:complete